MNTEELSKLWPAFQARYRPTAIYQVSVVLIESRRSTKPALPVRARRVHVVPFQHPVIDQVKSQASAGGPILENQPILAGFNLVLAGRQLRGEDTVINVGGIEVEPADSDVTDSQIIVPLPGGLQAGVQGVQVIQRTLLGSPPAPHRGFESNVAAFVLGPRVVEPIGIANLQGTGSAPRSARVDLTVDPAVGDTQRVVLFLNELIQTVSPPGTDEGQPQAYSFSAPSRIPLSPPNPPGSSQTISIPISGVEAGDYLVRIQVDGAESPLGTDASGQYNAPRVTIS
jgi:Pvc16 N-terminal domain